MSLVVCYKKDKVTHFFSDSLRFRGGKKIISSSEFNRNIWIPEDDPEAICAMQGSIRDLTVIKNIPKLTKNYNKMLKTFNQTYIYNMMIPMIRDALKFNNFMDQDEVYNTNFVLYVYKKGHTYLIDVNGLALEVEGLDSDGKAKEFVCNTFDENKEPLPAILESILDSLKYSIYLEFPILYINSKDKKFINITKEEAIKIVAESEGK